jgi:hypothetical protein
MRAILVDLINTGLQAGVVGIEAKAVSNGFLNVRTVSVERMEFVAR